MKKIIFLTFLIASNVNAQRSIEFDDSHYYHDFSNQNSLNEINDNLRQLRADQDYYNFDQWQRNQRQDEKEQKERNRKAVDDLISIIKSKQARNP